MTLTDRLRSALDHPTEGIVLLAGDERDDDIRGRGGSIMPAAVLVPVTDRAEPGVILTQRTETLSRHPGQIAFPGGRVDPGDADVTAAALREAEEEIGLPPARVTVIGAADRYRTVTGFEVTPIVGVVPPDLVLTPHEAEVAEVFEVPLAFLLDGANHVEASVEWQGRDRHYYEISWDGHRIWGATAAMIVNLSRRLRWTA
ncbi:8-oxo-dGTP pyrophosphatase MutT (NUDIX family) [Hephaestia caeni]|uniref:8-oxo-dGTP pyrophosphatase MutT (NUDIX family) n=1 Tax=Hephaestia caeni TaxID=645617 RepID=A0A397P6F4_9SPHN|nr:CoA pyrophosphatase [Hephaestia caeni]RIA43609.1 8-oxo-dGTP pyrophosphatase MutT (NUDIX family) [Hephaestia caeni]